MITRTPAPTNPTVQLRGLAAGSIGPAMIFLTGAWREDPCQITELSITRLEPSPHDIGTPWLAELRVDQRLTQHTIYRGPDAGREARAWMERASALLHAGATPPEHIPRTVAPFETAPASYIAARAEEEARRGVRLWKYFAPGQE